MSELGDQLREEVKRIIDEPDGPLVEFPPNKAPEIETEGIFDPSLLDSASYPSPDFDPFGDEPMKLFAGLVGDLKGMMARPSLGILPDFPATEHKVKIFWLNKCLSQSQISNIEAEMEAFLNDGYRCHAPATCGDFLIMNFSRRKDEQRQERQTNNDGSDKENKL